MGMAESIRSRYNNEDLQNSSELILRNSSNVLDMINQLLDVAKSDTGNLSLTQHKGDIINYIHYVSESLFAVASEKKIQLSFHAIPTALTADFDAEKLKHIIQNILSNALKYTKPGGKVMISLSSPENSNLLIKVKDTGVGIHKDDLPYIFDRFFQAKNASAGTGIGLALSKEFVELMGGVEGPYEVVKKALEKLQQKEDLELIEKLIGSLEGHV